MKRSPRVKGKEHEALVAAGAGYKYRPGPRKLARQASPGILAKGSESRPPGSGRLTARQRKGLLVKCRELAPRDEGLVSADASHALSRGTEHG